MNSAEIEVVMLKHMTATKALIERAAGEDATNQAWQSIQFLLLTRHYFGTPDPIDLAEKHKAMLADSWRANGHREDIALEVERIYESMADTLRVLLDHQRQVQDDDGELPRQPAPGEGAAPEA